MSEEIKAKLESIKSMVEEAISACGGEEEETEESDPMEKSSAPSGDKESRKAMYSEMFSKKMK